MTAQRHGLAISLGAMALGLLAFVSPLLLEVLR